MQLPQRIEVKGIRVLTSKQIAEKYGTTTDVIKQNFSANRGRHIAGKHYILFTGDELKVFKNEVRNPHLVGNRASHLYLWTERGTLLHAKSLNTDKAWEVYDWLVDFYFRAKENPMPPAISNPVNTMKNLVVDIPENVKAQRVISDLKKSSIVLEVLADESNRYRSMEDFEKFQCIASEIMFKVLGKINDFRDLKPGLLEKHL